SVCASWNNNGNASCSGLQDAIPPNSAQCGCRLGNPALRVPARVTVVKRTTENNGTFAFGNDLPSGNFSITTASGTGRHGPMVVDPGAYRITELAQPGWSLISATCSNGNTPDRLTLASGDDVVCTFVDSPILRESGTLTVVKL